MSDSSEGERAAAEFFTRTFGRPPEYVASAPGRVNLIGEHLDYNGGEVLPIAIERRTYVAASANGGSTVRAVSASASEAAEFSLDGALAAGKWWDYVAGVALERRARGHGAVGTDLAVWSDLPHGAGLGSSAALAIAAGAALGAVAGRHTGMRELALAAREGETRLAGVEVGIMDQFASALAEAGRALHVRCDVESAEPLPFTDAVLIFDTGVRRSLRDGRFNARREECARAFELLRRVDATLPALARATPELVRTAALPPPLDARARHVATEMERVRRAVEALAAGREFPGELLFASHASLRDDYACSIAELDWFVERARTCGARGARMTGAGWGGCAIAVGDADALAGAAPDIAREHRAAFGRTPQWWITRARAGATVAPYPPP